MAIVSEFMKPIDPPRPYEPEANVVAWAELSNGEVVLEVFKREGGSFGYRYQAWVAWRDAGDEVRSHDWYEIEPKAALFTDTLASARQQAAEGAVNHGFSVTEWKSAV